MTTDDDRLGAVRVWSSVLGSLVPWAALFVTIWLAEDELQVDVLPAAALLWLGFVALPSMVAIVAGRSAVTRVAVTLVMTGVTVFAGVQVATVDDGQAGLAVLLVPMVAFPLAGVVWIGGAVMRRWGRGGHERPAGPARTSYRLAALLVDVVVIGAVEVVPLTMLSHARAEVAAAVLGVVLATVYLATFIAVAGRTPGQALLGLAVVEEATGGPVAPGRAVLRSLVVVVEVAAAGSILAPVALAEVVAVSMSGRSLTDRVFGTSVVTGARG